MNYDPSDPNTLANPYPYFLALRNEDPIQAHEIEIMDNYEIRRR